MIGNILYARVTVTGVRPLLWHAFGPDALPLFKREKTGVAGNDPEEWRRTVLMTEARQLYLKPTYVFGALRDGARYTKKGRGTLQPLIAATLQVLDDQRILLDRVVPPEPLPVDPLQPVYLDVQSVKNPTTRARNVRYRIAASAPWRFSATILWDRTVVSRAEMEAVVIDTGRLVGIGDGRAIGYGRFTLDTFTVSETSLEPASGS
ncbi:MAG: hypothetical protein HGA45_42555 [Chloroflexales bacterium]|nr:hypothetical protein [Chloroflexales bacterium]